MPLRTTILIDEELNQWVKGSEYSRDELINLLLKMFKDGQIIIHSDDRALNDEILKLVLEITDSPGEFMYDIGKFMDDRPEIIAKAIFVVYRKVMNIHLIKKEDRSDEQVRVKEAIIDESDDEEEEEEFEISPYEWEEKEDGDD